MKVEELNKQVKKLKNTGEISDGYHTFDELYEHRVTLFIALCRQLIDTMDLKGYDFGKVWRSRLHSDGTSFDGWFILGVNKEKGSQITYHLPNKNWKDTEFAETLDKAPEFDGHTAEDVLSRIKNL